jgi:hypothetical protein
MEQTKEELEDQLLAIELRFKNLMDNIINQDFEVTPGILKIVSELYK